MINLDIHFIPLFSQNNTLILPEICFFTMLKQTKGIFSKEQIEEIVKKMIRGESTIKECFYDKNNYEEQKILKEIFDNAISIKKSYFNGNLSEQIMKTELINVQNKLDKEIFKIYKVDRLIHD